MMSPWGRDHWAWITAAVPGKSMEESQTPAFFPQPDTVNIYIRPEAACGLLYLLYKHWDLPTTLLRSQISFPIPTESLPLRSALPWLAALPHEAGIWQPSLQCVSHWGTSNTFHVKGSRKESTVPWKGIASINGLFGVRGRAAEGREVGLPASKVPQKGKLLPNSLWAQNLGDPKCWHNPYGPAKGFRRASPKLGHMLSVEPAATSLTLRRCSFCAYAPEVQHRHLSRCSGCYL